MQVRWLRAALDNVQSIAMYIAMDNPSAATMVVARIHEAVDLLANQPALGRPGRVTGTRELVIPGLPYIVPYRVKDNTVQILRVLHSSRQWPTKL